MHESWQLCVEASLQATCATPAGKVGGCLNIYTIGSYVTRHTEQPTLAKILVVVVEGSGFALVHCGHSGAVSTWWLWFGDLNTVDQICFHLALSAISQLSHTTTCDLTPTPVTTYANEIHASFPLKKTPKNTKTMSSLLGKEEETFCPQTI